MEYTLIMNHNGWEFTLLGADGGEVFMARRLSNIGAWLIGKDIEAVNFVTVSGITRPMLTKHMEG